MIKKRCEDCEGEIKHISGLYGGRDKYDAFMDTLKKEYPNVDWESCEQYNCIECGRLYDKDLKKKKLCINWL